MTPGAAQLDDLAIDTIRTLSMDAVEKAKSGHPGAPMALAPLAYLLYTRVMKHNPANAEWFDRDRFVLSAGHASMLLYSSLYLSGYGLTLDDLESFRQLGSPTAGHPGLGKLTAFYDNNHIQLAGGTEMAFSEDVPKRFEAYGWHVQDLGEDISLERMEPAIAGAGEVADRPSLIKRRTHIGYGSPNKQDTHAAHGSPLGPDEVRLTKEVYGWDPDAEFLVPDEVLAHFRETAGERGAQAESEWKERAEAYRGEFSDA